MTCEWNLQYCQVLEVDYLSFFVTRFAPRQDLWGLARAGCRAFLARGQQFYHQGPPQHRQSRTRGIVSFDLVSQPYSPTDGPLSTTTSNLKHNR